jgi:hypothetical protein
MVRSPPITAKRMLCESNLVNPDDLLVWFLISTHRSGDCGPVLGATWFSMSVDSRLSSLIMFIGHKIVLRNSQVSKERHCCEQSLKTSSPIVGLTNQTGKVINSPSRNGSDTMWK